MAKILKFYAGWCGPCQVLEKKLKELDVDYENIDIDSEEGNKLCMQYNIRSIPTLLKINDDDTTTKLVGASSLDKIKDFFK